MTAELNARLPVGWRRYAFPRRRQIAADLEAIANRHDAELVAGRREFIDAAVRSSATACSTRHHAADERTFASGSVSCWLGKSLETPRAADRNDPRPFVVRDGPFVGTPRRNLLQRLDRPLAATHHARPRVGDAACGSMGPASSEGYEVARVWLSVAGAAVACCLAMPCTSAWASDDWWGSLSDTDQRTVVNAMYSVTGRPAPYAEQDAEGRQAANLLVEKGAETTGEAGEVLGQAELDALQGSELLPPRASALVRVLGWAAERTPQGALVLVGSYLIYVGNRYVTMKMTTHFAVDPSVATGFHYTHAIWTPAGTSIYFGAKVPEPGQYLFAADDWPAGVRWFDEPCTFTGFTPPEGARMMTGVPSSEPGEQPQCAYPLPAPVYVGYADIFVDYPYIDETDLGAGGPIEPATSSTPVPNYPSLDPPPDVGHVRSALGAALSGDGGALGGALDEALLAADLLEQNPGDITEEQAPVIARECLRRVRDAGETSPRDACRGLPILSEGADGGEATGLDVAALNATPQWVLLHYVPADMREGNRDWFYPTRECPQPTDAMSCHEYPFWATAEGVRSHQRVRGCGW